MNLSHDSLKKLGDGDDPEQSIEEFTRLSGQGHSHSWQFDRDESHERATNADERQ
jgi:hypothetical protein